MENTYAETRVPVRHNLPLRQEFNSLALYFFIGCTWQF